MESNPLAARPDRARATVTLHVSRARNRSLLADLLSEHEVIDLEGAVPPETDLCVVDERGLAEDGAAFADWKREQRPLFAPVLLLTATGVEDPWSRYADAVGERVDAIQPLPAPRAGLLSRVESLLQTRRYTRELAGERELNARIFETSPVAKALLDTDGTVVRANERAAEVFGLSKSAMEERRYDAPEWEIIDANGDPIPSEDLPFARVMRTGDTVYGYEHGVVRPDGTRAWLSVNMAPLRDEDGDVEYLIAAVDDVTERKRQSERFRAFVEHSTDIVTVVDETGSIRYVSPSVQRVLGYDPEELLGEPVVVLVHPDDRADVDRTLTRAIRSETEGVVSAEYRVEHADGSWRWVESRGTAHSTVEGGYVVTTRDVTDQRERVTQLRVLDDVLRHNFYNHMNIVRGYAETIRDRSTGQTAADAATIVEWSDRLLQTTDKQREITKVLTAEPRLERVDVVGLARRTVESARADHPAADVRGDLPESAVARASVDLERAVAELVENAVAHTDAAEAHVEVRVRTTGESVVIDVTDDGPGIPEVERAVVTGERALGPLSHGSGLGLWLVSWIVRRSDETLTFEESDGGGTTVRVRVPAADPEPGLAGPSARR